ncbi:uncharacterized protein CCOS01_03620 [Colletotrichum costaricense]|uniref:Uncharacterized protein n=1 Tax=Colletotrichum costaricense TaxID=1209916 RepID=A0AAI9Z5N0_9PEZI|nr:uncharacterized protein CCOS01_03620 [Colletotrichum costaricense]KAK1534868.1 hypothetical protein CCOS01_03620 [Colletotrichum costaricense]
MHFIVSCPVWEDASPRLEVSGAGTFSCICPRLEEVWFSASYACLCVRTASEVPGAPPSRDQLIVFPRALWPRPCPSCLRPQVGSCISCRPRTAGACPGRTRASLCHQMNTTQRTSQGSSPYVINQLPHAS